MESELSEGQAQTLEKYLGYIYGDQRGYHGSGISHETITNSLLESTEFSDDGITLKSGTMERLFDCFELREGGQIIRAKEDVQNFADVAVVCALCYPLGDQVPRPLKHPVQAHSQQLCLATGCPISGPARNFPLKGAKHSVLHSKEDVRKRLETDKQSEGRAGLGAKGRIVLLIPLLLIVYQIVKGELPVANYEMLRDLLEVCDVQFSDCMHGYDGFWALLTAIDCKSNPCIDSNLLYTYTDAFVQTSTKVNLEPCCRLRLRFL